MPVTLAENNRTFTVDYSDGSVCIVKPVTWSRLDDFTLLQRELVEAFVVVNGALGEFFRPSNRKVWSLIEQMVQMLPTVSGDRIDLTRVDDIEDLQHIFVTTTTTTNADTGWVAPEDGYLSPSALAIIHGLNFFEVLKEAVGNARKPAATSSAPETASPTT